MKKNLLTSIVLSALLFFPQEAKSQMVSMPDSMLRNKLTSLGYGSCISGDSIDSSCPILPNLTYLDISRYQVHSLKGIDVFSSLRKIVCINDYWTIGNNIAIPALPASLDTLILEYNTISGLPTLPSSMIYMDISHDSLLNLPALPPSLVYLSCTSNLLSTLPILPSLLQYFYCDYNRISYLPTLPNSLLVLSCNNNLLSFLPNLQASLNYLYCNHNQLTALPSFPATLHYLDCSVNQLTSLPSLPSGMTILYCYSNFISTYPVLPSALYSFSCADNQITVLPTLPASLHNFYCSVNPLTTFPASLPPNLEEFFCVDNQLISLPPLPSSLVSLWCAKNQLASLPALSPVLTRLMCEHNLLTSMPSLPAGLNELNCCSNQITSLPAFPPNLYKINCDSNQLSSLPELPDSVYKFSINFNPALTCLPLLKTIRYFYFNNCPITCLPNYSHVYTSIPNINSLPLCNVFNQNGCDFFWNISGKTFFDPDANCLQSTGEQNMMNLHINLYKNNTLVQQAFSTRQGYYSFDTDSFGIYTTELDTVDFPFTSNCPQNNNYRDTLTVSDSLVYDDDFALRCNGIDLGVWSVVSEVLRPAHLSLISIRAGDLTSNYGVHFASGQSGAITVTINGNAHYYMYSMGSLAPSNVTGNVITYNIPDFGNLDPFTAISFMLETDTNATAGSSICFSVSVSALPGDLNLSNNTLSQCFLVHASLDPNDKEVYPAGIIDTSQHELTFTIRFQNTGNAPAENIYLLDTLDSNLDASTFQLLSTSHNAFVQILEGQVVRFNFPNINLPDSTSNEPMSHGFAQFKIRLKDHLPIGIQIRNTAYIYFDFNSPVVTNTTSNIIDVVNSVTIPFSSKAITVYPLPFTDEFMIDQNLNGSSFDVIDLLGNEIMNGKLNNSHQKINAAGWRAGIYFLRIQENEGFIVKKLIKQ